MKKPRSDSKLGALTDEQRELLAQWLLSGMGYETAVCRVHAEWGIRTSVGALSAFWQAEVSPRLLSRRTRAAEAAGALVAQAAAANPQLDAALRATLKQRAFEALIDPNAEPLAIAQVVGQAMTLGRIEAAEADRQLKERALSLQEQQKNRDLEIRTAELSLAQDRFRRETCDLFLKWAEDQRAKEVVASGAAKSEKIEALGRIMFGELWDARPEAGEGKA